MPFTTSADLHKAINDSWDAHGLDWEFKRLWDESLRDEFEALNDGEAMPETPYPYLVIEQSPGTTAVRMSGHADATKDEIHDVPFQFRIHAKIRSGDSRTAKEIAAELATLVMMKYGGHPTIPPKELTLLNGGVLFARRLTDWGAKSGDDEYVWTISYMFKLDVPVAV